LPLAGITMGWAAFASYLRIGVPPVLVIAVDRAAERALWLLRRMGWRLAAPAPEQPR
jgi:hypothetical protein